MVTFFYISPALLSGIPVGAVESASPQSDLKSDFKLFSTTIQQEKFLLTSPNILLLKPTEIKIEQISSQVRPQLYDTLNRIRGP